jgi:hypothetical protein
VWRLLLTKHPSGDLNKVYKEGVWHFLRRGRENTGVWCGNVRLKDTLGRTGCRIIISRRRWREVKWIYLAERV